MPVAHYGDLFGLRVGDHLVYNAAVEYRYLQVINFFDDVVAGAFRLCAIANRFFEMLQSFITYLPIVARLRWLRYWQGSCVSEFG
jgi:hypothetical protein